MKRKHYANVALHYEKMPSHLQQYQCFASATARLLFKSGNTTLASLLTATSLSQAEQLVGQTMTSADGSTSGQVASVSVTSAGAVATLTNGATVPLANGASVQ